MADCFTFKPMNNPELIKQQQLRKHKTLATGLFLLMLVTYISCVYAIRHYSFSWIYYVKAFSEAAMVGALADWFAVTALFHYPLGIRIPHTNLIENRKNSIGDNLGGFVVSNFLNADTLRPYLERLQVSSFAASWLKKEKNITLLTDELIWLFRDILVKADDATMNRFIARKAKDLLTDMKLNELLAGGMELIVERGDDQRILNYLLAKLKIFISENETLVRDKVKEESYFLIPEFVDNLIASKIVQGTVKYLSEIENNKEHRVRNDLRKQIQSLIASVKDDPKWNQELQEIRNSFLNPDRLQNYTAALWKSLQRSLIEDMASDDSAIKNYIKKIVQDFSTNLQSDEGMKEKIDHWVRWNAYRIILKNTGKAGDLISGTIGNWEGRELSNKLELEVGKDLQYIRINGTLVGGLVGLVIYILTKWLQ